MFMKNVNKWSLDDVKAIVNRVSELDEKYALLVIWKLRTMDD